MACAQDFDRDNLMVQHAQCRSATLTPQVPKDGCCEKCFQVCNKKKLLGLHMAALSKGQGWPMPVEVVILFSKAP